MTSQRKRIMPLAAAVLAGIMLISVPLSASATGSVIVPDTDVITPGNTIWFGGPDDPLQWTVLSGETDDSLPLSGTGRILLLSAKILGSTQFNEQGGGNAWEGSKAQQWCADYYAGWKDGPEKQAILQTSVTEENKDSGFFHQGGYTGAFTYGAASLNEEYFFFLSAQEAELFFEDSDSRTAGTSWWWLRSPYTNNENRAGGVDGVGAVFSFFIFSKEGARPAFNLNPETVLLMSAVEGGKLFGSGGGELYPVQAENNNDWKLTMLDSSRTFIITAANITGYPGETVAIPYEKAATGDNEYVSALVCGEDGKEILFYGSAKAEEAKGTAEFILPESGLTPGETYTVKVFNEQKNGEKETDYSSAFREISLTVVNPPESE